VLPHEITHTVFAYHFKRPVPRWADEGGSVLSEDDIERIRHDKLARSILNGSQQIQMRQLFALTEYPQGKVMHLYAQGYSVSNYLVMMSNRQHFLNFLGHGMSYGWDSAAWTYYKHRSVEELESAWLTHLRETKGMNHIDVAQGKIGPKAQAAAKDTPAKGTVVRLTVPPGLGSDPYVRAQAPDEEGDASATKPAPYFTAPGQGSQGQVVPASQSVPVPRYGTPASQPKYLPDYPAPSSNPNWHAPGGSVQLGQPQYVPVNPAGHPGVQPAAPVGFPQ
jgi:hypothetical protein